MRNLILLALLSGCVSEGGRSFAQLAYPVPVESVDLGGLKVAYTERGAGEPALVLSHGLASYLPVWSRNLDALAAHHRVIAIDLPGYGKSDKANFDYSMAFFARVVERVIEKLELGRVVLVGHSMGGQIAITHALRYPGRAEGLVLVAPAGLERFAPGEGSWMAEAMTKEFVMVTPPDGIENNFASNFWRMPDEARFMVRDRIAITGGPDFDAYAYAVSRSVWAMLHGPVADRLSEVRVPTLITFGEGDALIPNPILHGGSTERLARQAAATIPHAQLRLIPRAGHMVQFERPAEWNQAVLEFLSRFEEEKAND